MVSGARDAEALLAVLVDELKRLAETPPDRVETTLLIHPHVLTDFVDYNDVLDLADAVVAELDLEGVIQVASFHPQYCFAGSEADDLANATNRSSFRPCIACAKRALAALPPPFPGLRRSSRPIE